MPMLADAHISSSGYLWENTLSHVVEAARDLDLDFKWSCHGTVTSCMSRLGQINRVKHCFDNCTLILIINALVIITNCKKRWMVSWKRKIKKNTEFRASVERYWKYSRFPFVWLPELRIILCEYSFGMGANMASRLATGSEDDIFATNSWSGCTNKYKKATNFGLSVSGNYGLIACVASVSLRGSSRKLGQEQTKNERRGRGRGTTIFLLPL